MAQMTKNDQAQQNPQAKSAPNQTPSRSQTMTRGDARGQMRSPFSSMRRFMEEMDRMFDDFSLGRGASSRALSPFEGTQSGWMPQIEVVERDGKLEVRADLPGMKPENVNVSLENDVLTISGERQHSHEGTERGVFHCERSYGSFVRSVQLPPGVDPGTVDARFEDGVLEVTMPMPKREPAGKSIQVRTGPKATPGSMKS